MDKSFASGIRCFRYRLFVPSHGVNAPYLRVIGECSINDEAFVHNCFIMTTSRHSSVYSKILFMLLLLLSVMLMLATTFSLLPKLLLIYQYITSLYCVAMYKYMCKYCISSNADIGLGPPEDHPKTAAVLGVLSVIWFIVNNCQAKLI